MIPYGQLVGETKRLSPDDPVFKSGKTVSAGRRLNIVGILSKGVLPQFFQITAKSIKLQKEIDDIKN
jgi:hypothetical protein